MFKKSLIAASIVAMFSTAAIAVEGEHQGDSFPTGNQNYTEDVTLDWHGGDVNNAGEQTLKGNGENAFLLDTRHNKGAASSLSVTGGALTFENFKSFTLLADHSEYNEPYGIQGLYVLHGPSINIKNVKQVYLGTVDNPLVKTYAITAHSGKVNITGFDEFEVNSSHGLWATNSGGASAITIEGGSVKLNTDSFALNVSSYDNVENNASISIKGTDVEIVSKNNYAISQANDANVDTGATFNGTVDIQATEGDVTVTAKKQAILVYSPEGNSSGVTIKADKGAINLTGEEVIAFDEGSTTGTVNLASAKGINVDGAINFANGTLNLTNDKETLNLIADSKAEIGTLTGKDVAIVVNEITAGEKSVAIKKNATENVGVDFSASAVDAYTAEEAAKAMQNAVDLGTKDGEDAAEDGSNVVKGTLTGYGTNFTTTVDEEGNVMTIGSDITQSTMDMAAMTLVAWRNETTTLNDRMSTLRTSPSQFGSWVRWNGGEYQYDKRNLSNKFNTIEVGGDIDVGNNWIVGASLSYTKGEGDFQQGETDSDAYAGALYALWTHDGGSFVDMVMKTGRISTDYDFFNLQGGAVDAAEIEQTGFIMGVETGHRFNFTDMFYVEPQIQLTYSRLSGVHETTDQRTLDLEASDSLIGRVGLMAGINCPNNMGSAYVRISGLRDFRGDIDGTFSANGNEYAVKHELDDNWFEFSVGGTFKFADNFYGFADVQKSTGGDIDLDWRANVGVRAYF